MMTKEEIREANQRWYEAREEAKRRAESKGMCIYCDCESEDNMIYQDNLTGEWYLELQTGEWDSYDDDWIYLREYISYCPYCGREL